jgi:hypothetical protein
MSIPQEQAIDFVELLKNERKDSLKERKDLQTSFLSAIQSQTESQNLAMKTLGDRIERQMECTRADLRAMTSRIFWSFTIAIVVIASLAGVAVKYKSLQLTPTSDTSHETDNTIRRDNNNKTASPH